VECAVVYPVTFFIILSMIIGAMGIFTYQEMANLSRAAARFGSTHGAQYRKDAVACGNQPSSFSPGTCGTPAAANTPLDVTTNTSPYYNTAPWSTMLWFQTNPSATAGTNTDWANYIYDNSVRGNTVLLDPTALQMWVGWEPVANQPALPDNYPGARICACMKYQVFPIAFIWWNPDATLMTVSTSAMPQTN
jgi:hypothetical protein